MGRLRGRGFARFDGGRGLKRYTLPLAFLREAGFARFDGGRGLKRFALESEFRPI